MFTRNTERLNKLYGLLAGQDSDEKKVASVQKQK